MKFPKKVLSLSSAAASILCFAGNSDAAAASNSFPLMEYGKKITIPFPNDQLILGIGSLTYDSTNDIWTGPAEHIVGTDNKYPGISDPRFYRMKLNFDEGTIDFLDDPPAIHIEPGEGLKCEGMDIVPGSNNDEGGEVEYWVVSEANSHVVKTSAFLSKNFGPPDLNSYDPKTYSTSRLVRISSTTGSIVEEAEVPDFAQWQPQVHNWDATQCVGDRPFQGMHAISIHTRSVPSDQVETTIRSYSTMFVGVQSPFYQDGTSPKTFDIGRTRILIYNVSSLGDTSIATANYAKSFRYDTSQLTIENFQKASRHFNGLMAVQALNETSLLVAECEDFYSFTDDKIINRIFHVDLDPESTVDHCESLLDCDIDAPPKRLVWERTEKKLQLDGIAMGPTVIVDNVETPTLALTFDADTYTGVQFELLAINLEELRSGPIWVQKDGKDEILRNRILALSVSLGAVAVLIVFQIYYIRRLEKQNFKSKAHTMLTQDATSKKLEPSSKKTWKFKHYAVGTAMANSFLVGGVTFGFPGMVLMLRKDGVYADQCACGAFCSTEKEQIATVSTLGFAVAIGCRLFVGIFMDKQGPKTTAMICYSVFFVGFLLLAITPTEDLSNIFLYAWLLLSFGGSGVHVTGFHLTNLFKGKSKKAASAGISAAFGASSSIFPFMQIFNQFAGVSLQKMSIFYTCIVVIIWINNFFVQPWTRVQPGVPIKPNFKFWQKKWWKRGIKSKPLGWPKIFKICRKFEMWGETLFYSISLLLLTHFLSTAAQLLAEKGDVKFTTNPNDWTDYMYTRSAGWFNAFGFVWFPLVQYMIAQFSWSVDFITLACVNMAVLAIIMARSLEVQTIGFALLSMGRLMLFSFHHAYVLDAFGIQFFGTLNGISSLVAAIIGLLSYPLQLLGLGRSFSFSFVPIGCAVLLSFAFPLVLRRIPLKSWGVSYGVPKSKFRRPKTLTELKELVAGSAKIRCIGGMYSCSPLVSSEGIVISLENFDDVLEVDLDNNIVRVQGGATIEHICQTLRPHGFAIPVMGTIDGVNIAGALMTGTHGLAIGLPALHAFVESYQILKADGSVVEVNRGRKPDIFAALAPSMGVMGIVTQVAIRIVPLEHLEARIEEITFAGMIPQFAETMERNKYARMVVYPSIDKVTVWIANPVEEGAAVESGAQKQSGVINFRDDNEKSWLVQYQNLTKTKSSYDEADAVLEKVVKSQLKRLAHYEGQYNHVLALEKNNGIPVAQLEFAFDFSEAENVLGIIQNYCKSNRIPHYSFEITASKKDDALLSCSSGHDEYTLWVCFQAKSNIAEKFFVDLEKLFTPGGYRKHWGNGGLGYPSREYMESCFTVQEIDEFASVMMEFDPDGKFRNTKLTNLLEKNIKRVSLAMNTKEANLVEDSVAVEQVDENT